MADAAEVDRLFEALEQRYGVFPVVEESQNGIHPEVPESEASKLVGHMHQSERVATVHVWVDRIGTVLLYRQVGPEDTWQLPTGSVESVDPDAVEAAAGDAAGQVADVDCEVTDVVEATRTTVTDPAGEHDPVEKASVYVSARHTGGLARVPDDDTLGILEVDWHDSLPEDVGESVERIADRV